MGEINPTESTTTWQRKEGTEKSSVQKEDCGSEYIENSSDTHFLNKEFMQWEPRRTKRILSKHLEWTRESMTAD